ncbi:MAG TPA: hypothetical protein VE822_02265, partial [Candidatus Elarobacter sp.]|nr:hypothetical protein [Candidatus Elarobacter sp.]
MISTPFSKNPHFYGLFCDFALRSVFSLAIVPSGPSFFAGKWGELARGLLRFESEWKEKIRRISILDGSQA